MNEPFTAIPNQMLDVIISSELSERQIKVVLAIIRQTLGYQRESTPLSLLDIQKSTNIAKSHISLILKQLQALHVIEITENDGRKPQIVKLETDVSKWLTVTKSVTVTESVTVTKSVTKGYQIGNGKVTKSVTPTYKRNIKENSKERESAPLSKNTYGHNKLVKLTDNEYQELCRDFGESNTKNYIERLDSYLKENSNKQYNDHAATIRQWLNQDRITNTDTSKYEMPQNCGGIW